MIMSRIKTGASQFLLWLVICSLVERSTSGILRKKNRDNGAIEILLAAGIIAKALAEGDDDHNMGTMPSRGCPLVIPVPVAPHTITKEIPFPIPIKTQKVIMMDIGHGNAGMSGSYTVQKGGGSTAGWTPNGWQPGGGW